MQTYVGDQKYFENDISVVWEVQSFDLKDQLSHNSKLKYSVLKLVCTSVDKIAF